MPTQPPPVRRRTTVKKELADAVAAVLGKARRALFITGAGISADSGLPTYRGIGGLYDGAAADEGLPIETILSGEMMARRPELTWKHLHRMELACRGAEPNRGHEILAELEQRLDRTLVFTQNVDGLRRVAGSKNVIAIHGDLHDLRCTACHWRTRVPDFAQLSFPPRCPECRAIVRPEVVLFGEALPPGPFQQFEDELAKGFDVVFAIGTSALFPYIARPVLVARSEGIPTVEINPGDTDLSEVVQYRLKATARTALKAIWAAYKALAPRRTMIGH
ncbi:MAG: NAD-dependent protein deacylase [Deltaproteobacteria bacterium]|nr:NAD-dependent protein deacylase [Deltaproteobacteria bacterium]